MKKNTFLLFRKAGLYYTCLYPETYVHYSSILQVFLDLVYPRIPRFRRNFL